MSRNSQAYLLLILATLLWGSFYVVGKVVMQNIPPVMLMMFRYGISSIILVPILLAKKEKFVYEKKDRRLIVFIGIVGYALGISLQSYGTKLASASTASLINSMNPVFILFFAVVLLKEKLTLVKLLALITVLAGAYLIIGGAAGGALLGILLSLLSVVLWSLCSVLLRPLSARYKPMNVTAACAAIATAVLIPASLAAVFIFGEQPVFSLPVVVSLLYMGAGTAVSFMAWNTALSRLEASRCSLFYPIQPLTSVILGVIFLGETLSLKIVLGGILILAGILASVIFGSKKPAAVS